MSIVPEFFLNFFDKIMPSKTEVQDSTKKKRHLLQILWPALGLAASERVPLARQNVLIYFSFFITLCA